ncbi:hypothetical protein QBC37DRAFT_367150 [Rhypophila decipiens]|uniref:Uncharacterized protein n=1 Tax=Rhypophila decipiens TaxID=261697 RepID=A0AAN7BDN0_9PEZI|nr:hypothetical protein QBC37DRAFT_367150 [Rhypophila decipiens]
MAQHKMKPEEEGGAVVSPAELPGDQPKTASTALSEAGESIASTTTNSVIFTPDGSTCGEAEEAEATPRATFSLPYRPAPTSPVDAVIDGLVLLDLGPKQQPEQGQTVGEQPGPAQPEPMSKPARKRLNRKMRKMQEQQTPPPEVTSSSRGQRKRLREQLKKNKELREQMLSELQQPELSQSKRDSLKSRLENLEKRLRKIEQLQRLHQSFLSRKISSEQSQKKQPSPQAQPQPGPEPQPEPSKRQNKNRKTNQRQAKKRAEKRAAKAREVNGEEPSGERDEEAAKAREFDDKEPSGEREEDWEDVEEPKEKQLPRRKEIITDDKIAELFNDYFGDRKLANWQRFCIDLGLEDENLSSLKQCKTALNSIHINIYDLMDAIEERKALPEEERNSPLKVRKFDSANQLFKHAKKNGGLFPRRAAKEGGPLRGLLKQFYGPGGGGGGGLPRGGGVLV